MQRVVAYLLERESGLATNTDPETERERTVGVFKDWLDRKGGKATDDKSGVFTSKSKGADTAYVWKQAQDGSNSWSC